jgi:PKHD-type hydroxylase
MLHIPEVLTKQQVTELRQQLDASQAWVHGQHSAGIQAQKIKHNLQIDVNSIIYQSFPQNIACYTAAPSGQISSITKHILAPLFNCYQHEGSYGNHVDSAVQYSTATGQAIRTDVSITLFLSEPDEYEGGELVVEDHYGSHDVKLDAGDAILYPATSLHRVEAVTAGKRVAAFTWLQSMVKDDWQRSMLFNLDMTIMKLRQQVGDSEEIIHLTSHYHNLLRQWGDL